MAKVFRYHGKTFEEIQAMSFEEFTKILPSGMKRHVKRGFTDAEKILMKKIEKHKGEKPIRTQVRNMIILPNFVGKKFMIHNGKEWVLIEITEEMIAHKLGEFSRTRKQVKHSGPGIGATKGTKFAAVK